MTRILHASVKVAYPDHAVHLQLSRSERYNAIDRAMLHALIRMLESAHTSNLVLILSGTSNLFSVGPDINELAGLNATEAADFSRLAHRVVQLIETWPAATIAHLEGYCLGSALELALACDVVVGSEDVRLGLPGLAWAMVPCMGGLRRLSQRTGADAATRMFLSGDVIDGREALARRLLQRLVHEPREVLQLAKELSEYGPSAVAALRSIRLQTLGIQDAESEIALFAQPFVTGECQRRLRALLTE